MRKHNEANENYTKKFRVHFFSYLPEWIFWNYWINFRLKIERLCKNLENNSFCPIMNWLFFLQIFLIEYIKTGLLKRFLRKDDFEQKKNNGAPISREEDVSLLDTTTRTVIFCITMTKIVTSKRVDCLMFNLLVFMLFNGA